MPSDIKPDIWDYHEQGNPDCDACLIRPGPCECGEGLVHTHFAPEMDAIEARCDHCQRDVLEVGVGKGDE